jgi:hypothetical protein
VSRGQRGENSFHNNITMLFVLFSILTVALRMATVQEHQNVLIVILSFTACIQRRKKEGSFVIVPNGAVKIINLLNLNS